MTRAKGSVHVPRAPISWLRPAGGRLLSPHGGKMFDMDTLHDVFGSHGELFWAIGGAFLFCLVAELIRRYRGED